MTALNSAVSCALVDMNEQIKARVGKGMATQDAVVAVAKETLTKHQRTILASNCPGLLFRDFQIDSKETIWEFMIRCSVFNKMLCISRSFSVFLHMYFLRAAR